MTPFVILSTGRSGSTLLCKALSDHPGVHAYGEVFHLVAEKRSLVNGTRYRDDADPIRYLQDVVWKDPNETGKPVIGFKLFHFHARLTTRQVRLWDYLRANPQILKVLLIRENVFDVYVSTQRARSSDIWHIAASQASAAAELRRCYNTPLTINPKDCISFLNSCYAGVSWLKSSFQGDNTIIVTYKEMKDDLQSAVNRIFAHLGTNPHEIKQVFDELCTVPHSEGIRNWSRVRNRLARTIYREFIIGNSAGDD